METVVMPNELVVVANLNAVEVFTGKEGVEKIIADIESKVKSFKPDVSTLKGRKDIASLAYKVSQSKVVLDDLGKNLVSDWKAKSALVDASRKIARDKLDLLRDEVREPLTAWEAEEEKRLAAEKLGREIDAAQDAAIIENDLFNRSREIAKKEAEIARIEAERVAAETAAHAQKLAQEEAEKAEAARIANEERIRKEAAEKAQREEAERAAAQIAEAERKAKEAQAAVEKAERDRIAEYERAQREQAAAVAAAEEKARIEAARVESERKAKESAEAAKIEAERKEAERKAADVEHRKAINNEIVSGLIAETGISQKQAQLVVAAIAKGMINHVRINY